MVEVNWNERAHRLLQDPMAKLPRPEPELAANRVTELVRQLDERMATLQADSERHLARAPRKTRRVPAEPNRAVAELLRQTRRLRFDLEERLARASKEAEGRADRFWSSVGQEAVRRLRPLLERLELPAAREIRRLTQRVEELERRLEGQLPPHDRGAERRSRKANR